MLTDPSQNTGEWVAGKSWIDCQDEIDSLTSSSELILDVLSVHFRGRTRKESPSLVGGVHLKIDSDKGTKYAY